MLGYVTIGVSDMAKAQEFYGALFAEVGGKELFGFDRIKFYGTSKEQAMIAICIPHNEGEASCGNGGMVAIPADSHEKVDALYATAMSLGATDEGEPGERVPDFFYGAYVRDADGNKVCFYKMA